MFFTQEDYKKIEEYLKRTAIKDSEFNTIQYLNQKDFIPVLHNNINSKISVRDLYKGIGKNNIINFNEYIGDYNLTFSLKDVITNIKETHRIPGCMVTFMDSKSNQWETYQFNSHTVDNWLNEEYWRNLYENTQNKFKGFFPNEALLYKACLLPYLGDYAYVGNTLGEALIYVCTERGRWSKTLEMVISNSAAILR